MEAKRIYRDFMPAEKARWESAVAETEAEWEEIVKKGRAVLAALRRKNVGRNKR